mmetsp:Transcript_22966/g.26658  ORF Transcript_22966/g.26658 Transcript_22966/m.26658 type:complete len:652 (+) Transcript_22966:3-1958(+)
MKKSQPETLGTEDSAPSQSLTKPEETNLQANSLPKEIAVQYSADVQDKPDVHEQAEEIQESKVITNQEQAVSYDKPEIEEPFPNPENCDAEVMPEELELPKEGQNTAEFQLPEVKNDVDIELEVSDSQEAKLSVFVENKFDVIAIETQEMSKNSQDFATVNQPEENEVKNAYEGYLQTENKLTTQIMPNLNGFDFEEETLQTESKVDQTEEVHKEAIVSSAENKQDSSALDKETENDIEVEQLENEEIEQNTNLPPTDETLNQIVEQTEITSDIQSAQNEALHQEETKQEVEIQSSRTQEQTQETEISNQNSESVIKSKELEQQILPPVDNEESNQQVKVDDSSSTPITQIGNITPTEIKSEVDFISSITETSISMSEQIGNSSQVQSTEPSIKTEISPKSVTFKTNQQTFSKENESFESSRQAQSQVTRRSQRSKTQAKSQIIFVPKVSFEDLDDTSKDKKSVAKSPRKLPSNKAEDVITLEYSDDKEQPPQQRRTSRAKTHFKPKEGSDGSIEDTIEKVERSDLITTEPINGKKWISEVLDLSAKNSIKKLEQIFAVSQEESKISKVKVDEDSFPPLAQAKEFSEPVVRTRKPKARTKTAYPMSTNDFTQTSLLAEFSSPPQSLAENLEEEESVPRRNRKFRRYPTVKK